MKKFEFVYLIPPVDFWNDAIICEHEDRDRVLFNMPEETRDGLVAKMYIPGFIGCELFTFPIFICKADNNGNAYIFSDRDLEKSIISYFDYAKRCHV